MTGRHEQEAAFFAAVVNNRVEEARQLAVRHPELLSLQEPDTAVAGRRDKTALHKTAMTQNHEMACMLIELGAPLEATDQFGLTPLMMATQYRNFPLVKKLIDAGADPFHNTRDNMTPLMFAAGAGDIDSAKLFVQLGLDVNSRRDCGMVALHFARRAKDRLDFVTYLVGAGADATLMNNALETPAILAARMDDPTYAGDLATAQKRKEIRDAAKVLTDQQDRDVLEHGLPAPVAVRRQPLRLNVRA